MTDAIARLKRWRDVGDGPVEYTAGSKDFAEDVKVALSVIEHLRAELLQAQTFINRLEK